MKFKIEVEMKDRWVPHFIGMLNKMQYLGSIGSSRCVCFYSDGDGDFNPRFTFIGENLPSEAQPLDGEILKKNPIKCDFFYDAG